jgi:NAD(P)-dependent dehydrogenase (short-subunit alcohol dehydrogenase family)
VNDKKIAIITGGTSGIGKGIAHKFAKSGIRVVILGRNRIRGESIVNEIKDNGGSADFFLCDLSEKKSILEFKTFFFNKYSKLDILINNAGILLTNTLEEINEDWELTFRTNLDSALWMSQFFMPSLIENKGCIVNISSEVGLPSMNAGRANYAYSVAKAALIKFSNKLALNYAKYKVRVNCVCPGIIDTPIYTNRDFSRFEKSIPLGYVGNVEDVANAVFFLVSDDSSYITGSVLTVDGGASL